MPKEWKEHGFGNHVVEDVRNQEWEYRGNEIVQGIDDKNKTLLAKIKYR